MLYVHAYDQDPLLIVRVMLDLFQKRTVHYVDAFFLGAFMLLVVVMPCP